MQPWLTVFDFVLLLLMASMWGAGEHALLGNLHGAGAAMSEAGSTPQTVVNLAPNCKLLHVSSETKHYAASNLLLIDPYETVLWLSSRELPQSITIQLPDALDRNAAIRCVGWSCLQGYTTNPRVVELEQSRTGSVYSLLQTLEADKRPGAQLFDLTAPLDGETRFLRFHIKETFSAKQVNISRLLLFEQSKSEVERALAASEAQRAPPNTAARKVCCCAVSPRVLQPHLQRVHCIGSAGVSAHGRSGRAGLVRAETR